MPEDTEIDTSGHPSAHRCPDGCPLRAERDQAVAEVAHLRRYLTGVAQLAHDALDDGGSASVA